MPFCTNTSNTRQLRLLTLSFDLFLQLRDSVQWRDLDSDGSLWGADKYFGGLHIRRECESWVWISVVQWNQRQLCA